MIGAVDKLFVREPAGARRPQRKRTLGIHQHLNLLLDAFPFCEHDAYFTNPIPEPRRKPRRFEIQEGKTSAGEIKHKTEFTRLGRR